MIHAESNFQIVNRHGDIIYATITWPTGDRAEPQTTEGEPLAAKSEPLPLVIVLHGFKGFRNWGFFPMAAQHMADANMLVIRMDFSQNGMQGTADRVLSLPDFAANTISRELDDVADLLGYMRESSDDQLVRLRDCWNGMLHFVGHSRGGGIAQVAGVEHEARSVVVWNSVGAWERWTPRQRNAWLETGIVEVENTRTGQKLQMNSTYVQDIEANRKRQSLVNACRGMSERLLFIHAEHDLTVPLKEVRSLLGSSDGNAALSVVSNSTHTFGMTHPLEYVSSAFADVLTQTTAFFQNLRNLQSDRDLRKLQT